MPSYTPEEKALAKSLVVAYDSTTTAMMVLREVWDDDHVPSASTLASWKNNREIGLRQDLIDEINQQTRQRMISQAGKLADKIYARIERSIDGEEPAPARDVKELVIGWAVTADKILGNKYSPGIQINAGPGSQTFVTFGPAPMPQQVEAPRDERVIDLD